MELPKISPEDRQRLRASLEREGVLVPIIEASDGTVLDGKIRLELCAELGITAIPRVIVGGVDSPAAAEQLRTDVNALRRHLTRAQLRALIEYEIKIHPERSDRHTARKTGVSPQTVGRIRATVPEGTVGCRLGEDGKYRTTVQTHSDKSARDARRLLGALGDAAGSGPNTLRDLRHQRWEQEKAEKLARIKPGNLPADFAIKTGHFTVLSQWIGADSVDLLWSDPPWKSNWAANRRDYARACFEVLRPNGILVAQSGVDSLLEFADHYREAGFVYTWGAAMVRHTGAIRHDRIRNSWCPVLLFRKPPLKRFRPFRVVEDVIRGTNYSKDHHCWESPVTEYIPIIKAISDPGSRIGDIALGSGTTALATFIAGEGRTFAGGDLSASCVRIAKSRVAAAMTEAKKSAIL